MKQNKKKVGERIREIRTNLGYSMDEFGSLLGDSPRSSVNNWEKGVSIPKRDKLEKIAILGNMLPDQILYGRADEYLYDLIDSSFNVKFSDNILYEIFESVPPEKRSYDDLMWLAIAKYFIDNGTYGKVVGKFNYSSMLGIPNLYTGSYQNEFIEQREDYKQQEVKYYVYADPGKNILHIMPFVPNEKNIELLYECPELLEQKADHEVFTANFEQIGLTLKDSTIIYYGIDKQKLEAKTQAYKYDEAADLYRVTQLPETLSMFDDEIRKQISILKSK